ncbi:6-pyruvoyl tetrahydrobiopterin synthase [Vogesella sp. EB]|uniref:6-pyruvoyl trahydropterin synthase family protein n=1 Tax=Vogesella sp. EB TaxID=1526735 RepID=UPI00064CDCA7|nr:6-carboxytetrahydropterin synthase [Vogesella sp. EB]KMJ54082.1 6-pyruvoyl tetrahydrobiopterin synthase [Vogesella sp. EB]
MNSSHILAGASFEAARNLAGIGEHGHSFRVLARADAHPGSEAALHAELAAAVAPFHYAHVNATLADGSDLSIARYLASQCGQAVSLQLASAADRGVLLAEDGSEYIYVDTRFEAAHQLPHVAPGHKCGRLHGHGFGVRIVADASRSSLNDILLKAWPPLFARLNHKYLNDIAGLDNPTSEVMAAWLYRELAANLAGLAWVEVRETHTAGSQFDGQTYRIWKEQHFESAVPFDAAGNYTGHSYLIRLLLQGSVDRVMGWVLDFGDVKDRFKPVYRQLDHNPLDKLPGIRAADAASVAEWVHGELKPLVPELARIDLMETPQRGVSLTFRGDMQWPLL